jgi:hypothetical protein
LPGRVHNFSAELPLSGFQPAKKRLIFSASLRLSDCFGRFERLFLIPLEARANWQIAAGRAIVQAEGQAITRLICN